MRALAQWHRDEAGTTTVEVVLAIGAFLLILLGVLEFAIDMWIWNSMTMAVQQGGRAAMVYCQDPTHQSAACNIADPCGNAGLTSYVTSAIQLPANVPAATLSCTAAASPVPALLTITASYTVGSMSVPGATGAGLIPGFTLTTHATVPLN